MRARSCLAQRAQRPPAAQYLFVAAVLSQVPLGEYVMSWPLPRAVPRPVHSGSVDVGEVEDVAGEIGVPGRRDEDRVVRIRLGGPTPVIVILICPFQIFCRKRVRKEGRTLKPTIRLFSKGAVRVGRVGLVVARGLRLTPRISTGAPRYVDLRVRRNLPIVPRERSSSMSCG